MIDPRYDKQPLYQSEIITGEIYDDDGTEIPCTIIVDFQISNTSNAKALLNYDYKLHGSCNTTEDVIHDQVRDHITSRLSNIVEWPHSRSTIRASQFDKARVR